MGVKLLVCYPSGAGGWWLSNLIHKLETNQYYNEQDPVVNFHHHPKSNNVYLTHYPITALPNDLIFKHSINFTGRCFFNFYINVIEKLYIDSKKIGESFSNDCHQMSCEALNKFNFPAHTDLDYALIFNDPAVFIENLFSILNESGISYAQNTDLCLRSIEQFKQSCPQPYKYYGDYSSPIWLGWCIGLLKYMKQPIPDYDKNLKDNLMQYHNLFLEISKDVTLNFNGDQYGSAKTNKQS